MGQEKKKANLKTFKALLLIGVLVLIGGIALFAVAIAQTKKADRDYDNAMAEYNAEYKEWYNNYSDGKATLFDKPEMPDKDINIFLFFPASIISGVGLILIVVGVYPFFAKSTLKTGTEVTNYLKDDYQALRNAEMDTVKPIVDRAMDDFVAPAITKTVRAVKKGKTDASTVCPSCGAKLEKDAKFCQYCGTHLDN